MNCGVDCPAGWVLLHRSDRLNRDGEWMLDDGGCIFNDQFHRLCCPPDQEAPTCGWYNFNNGNCDAKCPEGTFEIGGTDRGCSTVNGNYQAACCTTGKNSTALYEKCQWGDSFDCKAYKCPVTKSDLLVSSCNGNGGSACAGDWKTNVNEERKYCCDSSDDQKNFDDCTWESYYSSTGYQAIPEKGEGKSGYCFSNCPKVKVRVAMEHDNTCKKKTGSRAKCCSPNHTTTIKVVDPLVALWETDLKAWLEKPKCDSGFGYDFTDFDSFTKRSYTDGASMSNLPRYMGLTSGGSSIEKRQGQLVFQSNYALIVLTDIIYGYRSTSMTAKAVKEVASWNKIIGAQFTYLTTTHLIPFLKNVVDELYDSVAEKLAARIICSLDYWDKMVEASTLELPVDLTCENVDRDSWDPEYLVDPETYGTSSSFQQKRGSSLEKRDGSSRDFTVDCGIDPVTGLRRIMIISSQSYPNGGQGDNLQRANGLTVRFALANAGACTDTTIDPNAPNNIWRWVSKYFISDWNKFFSAHF
jgi:chitinase